MTSRLFFFFLCASVLVLSCSSGSGDIITPPAVGPDCLELTPLEYRTTKPSAVTMFFTANECETGAPYAELTPDDFVLQEGNRNFGSDDAVEFLPDGARRAYVTILIDVSHEADESREDAIFGANLLAEQLIVDSPPEQIFVGVELFDGTEDSILWEPPTADLSRLRERIEELAEFEGPDASTSNLNGAVRHSVERLRDHQEVARQHNRAGIATSGFVVVFAEGEDTAGRETSAAAADAVEEARSIDLTHGNPTRVETFAITTKAREALAELVGEDAVRSVHQSAIISGFSSISRQINRSVESQYILTYCSNRRGGTHFAHAVLQGYGTAEIGFAFSAEGFEPGCSEEQNWGCDGAQCGGVYCGGCDDHTESCTASGACVDSCLEENLCNGGAVFDPYGNRRSCVLGDEIIVCDGVCTEALVSNQHCGACGNECPEGISCVDGQCPCEEGGIACDGVCIDHRSDTEHCGDCGEVCPEGISCVDGECRCPEDDDIVCSQSCVDSLTDEEHCGFCDNQCPEEAGCVDGECACPDGGEVCNETCVDLQTSWFHCGECNISCPTRMECIDGECGCPDGGGDCNGECVDLNDSENCGGCGVTCSGGEICSDGDCIVSPLCPFTPCEGLTYCEESTGQCEPGCDSDEQCDADQVCNLLTRECGLCEQDYDECAAGCCTWHLESVGPGSSPQMVLDDDGHPHVAARGGNQVRYIHWDGAQWVQDDIDGSSYPSGVVSIALDSTGAPHLAYASEDSWSLYYARLTATGWDVELVLELDDTTFEHSIVVDDQDRPHIAFEDNALKYAHFDGAQWQIETIDQHGQGPSMAVDSDGNIHISHSRRFGGAGHLYTRQDGAQWITEEVSEERSSSSSMVLDEDNRPHIVTQSQEGQTLWLRYYHFNGMTWTVVDFDELEYSTAPSIAVDQSASPTIAFRDNDGLHSIRWDGSQWVESVVFSGNVGGRHSIATDDDDHPYFLFTSDGIKLSRYGADWP